jgi:hypothetical protein
LVKKYVFGGLGYSMDNPRAAGLDSFFSSDEWSDQGVLVSSGFYVRDLDHAIIMGDWNITSK